MERRFTLGIHKNEVTGEDFVGCDYEKGECNDSCLGGTCKWSKKALKRLAELEDKIEQGTLIELPCKVGDTVYVISNVLTLSIIETTIDKIVIAKSGLRLKLARNSFYETAISSLGERLFLTREEAEKRLKELQE